MSPWLKAGLIGAAILVVLNLLGIIPCVGVITCILGLLAYIGIGALAAYYMPPLRDAGAAAGQGALAAVLAAAIGGVVNTIVGVVRMAVVDSAQVMAQIPPETLRQLEEAGIDPQIFEQFTGPGGAVISGSVCCLISLLIAAGLGAIGGAIYASMRQE